MSTIYCTFCNRKSAFTKYKRYMCDACFVAFEAGMALGANLIKDRVAKMELYRNANSGYKKDMEVSTHE